MIAARALFSCLLFVGCGRSGPGDAATPPSLTAAETSKIENLEDRDIATSARDERDVSATSDTTSSPEVAPRAIPKTIAWVAIGATASPSATQLSIEDELLAVERRLGPDHGLLFFAGGPGSRGILTAGRDSTDRLLVTLGDLLGAVTDRDSHFRALRVTPHGPATTAAITEGLARALSASNDALVLWLAGHGVEVEDVAAAEVTTWGGGSFGAADLERLLAASSRPVRLIGTQCYGAGFAEALIAHDDRACGAFAAVWTLPASGCDPSPDAARTSYGVHLLDALGSAKDLDGDGQVGLSEAHVAAVLEVGGIDVPMLSSQHLLAGTMGTDAEADPARAIEVDGDGALVEERFLVEALSSRLGVQEGELPSALEKARADYGAAGERDDERALSETTANTRARAGLFARWPELEDPWHPDFAPTLQRERDAIMTFLKHDPHLLSWVDLRDARSETLDRFDRAERHLRALERLEVVVATLRFAKTAQKSDPTTHERFMRLRRCERMPLFVERTP